MTDALPVVMWEAVAAPGRVEELLRWALAGPPGTQVFRSGAQEDGRERVVVLADEELPEPPAGLVARPPHAWAFTRVR